MSSGNVVLVSVSSSGRAFPCLASEPHAPSDAGVLSPSEEARGFRLPEGFEVELVAAETPAYGKFVSLAFDARGRLWTMTARVPGRRE